MAVSKDDLFVAIQWLDVNEDALDRNALRRVARFLEAELARRERTVQALRDRKMGRTQ